MAILLEVMKGALRGIDGKVGKVGAPKSFELGIQIREVAPLQQRVVAEVDAARNVLRHKGDLLRLGKEVIWHPIEHQAVPLVRVGSTSSGMILVGSSTSKSNHQQRPDRRAGRRSSHSGNAPDLMACHKSRL